MRVTNKMLSDAISRSIMLQSEQLYNAQETVSTQKKINRPSDDPIGIQRALDFRKTLSRVQQYRTNITQGQNRLTATESVLKGMTDQLAQVRGIIVNGGGTSQANTAAADLVHNIRNQVQSFANETFNGEYLFAGFAGSNPPFTDSGTNVVYNGDNGDFGIAVGNDSRMVINVSGDELFSLTGTTADIFSTLDAIENEFRNGSPPVITQQMFDDLDSAMDRIEGVRTTVGIDLDRLDMLENHWKDFQVGVEDMLAETEDADVTQAVVELQSMENAYQTALAMAAQIMQQPGLVAYLS